jgi:hypothetical protein
MQMNRYDEDQEISVFASWVIIIVFSACIVIFGYIVYRIIPDAPRSWNFGQLGDTPAATIFSTEEPKVGGKLQRQLPMIPGAYPQNPVPAELKRREDQP